jgi:hypothetical protein
MIFDLSLSTVLTIIWSGVFVLAIFALTHWALQQPDVQSEMIRRLVRPHHTLDNTNPASKPIRDNESTIEILVVDTTDIERDLKNSRSHFEQTSTISRSVDQRLARQTHRRTSVSFVA